MKKNDQTGVLDWNKRCAADGSIREIYDGWASEYDHVIREKSGYLVPERAVEVLKRFVSPDSDILDAGAGTGIVGELLHLRGFHRLVAIDISAGMLEEARGKGIYRSLMQQTLGEPLDLPSSSFHAVIAVGAFGPTHAPTHAFDELVRVVVPGGYIVFSMRVDECTSEDEFGRKILDMERSHSWTRVARTERFKGFSAPDIDLLFRVWGYRIS